MEISSTLFNGKFINLFFNWFHQLKFTFGDFIFSPKHVFLMMDKIFVENGILKISENFIIKFSEHL